MEKKIAIVHDWLFTIGGAEKTLFSILELIKADIFTLGYDPRVFINTPLKNISIYTSFLQKIPFFKKFYRYFLPLFPITIEQFDLSNYDVVISSSHAVAKGILTHPDQYHICYCYTPIRYAWDLYFEYMKILPKFLHPLLAFIFHYIRIWDAISSYRADKLLAISKYVARRIEKFYKLKAEVIYPPVEVNRFKLEIKKDNYYITIGRLVSYKRFDLIIKAFEKLPDKRLLVIGEGPELKKLKNSAPKNVEFLGRIPDSAVQSLLQKAKGFIYAALEDFGIAVVEAQACGTPVIAYGRGGVLETVQPNKTGIFFFKQEISSIIEAINKFEKIYESFDPKYIRNWALKFDKSRFQKEFLSIINNYLII